MKTIHFHALKDDLLLMLELVEQQGSLKYVRIGNFVKNELNEGIGVIENARQIPHLGQATAASSTASQSFLVSARNTQINLRNLRGTAGVERVCLDQLVNPDTVVMNPGGMWGEDVLLEGQIGTASSSPISQGLMKRFNAAIRKTYQKIRALYVGPRALVLLESGKRLTMSAQAAPEFDLVRDNPRD
jgi:hypothetical protein